MKYNVDKSVMSLIPLKFIFHITKGSNNSHLLISKLCTIGHCWLVLTIFDFCATVLEIRAKNVHVMIT